MPKNMKFGELIKTRRAALSMSLNDISKLSGLSKAHIYELEISKTANPTVTTIGALALALKVKPEVLFRAAL